jgi:6-phosphogluconolactonase
MAPAIEIVADASALYEAAADRFVQLANTAIHDRGRFSVALSGGSTPRSMYARIAMDAAHVGAVAWPHVHFFWGDERVVPPDHADSNFRMASEAMLDHLPLEAGQIHRMRGEDPDPARAAAAYEQELREFFQLTPEARPRFDLVLLGLGPDGHTASLFPGTAALAERTRLVTANHVPRLGVDRITLTAPAINAAANILFLAEGAGKADTLKDVLEGPRDPDRLPSQLIQPDNGTLTWMIDAAAARRLRT